jgi:hypothetical protein
LDHVKIHRSDRDAFEGLGADDPHARRYLRGLPHERSTGWCPRRAVMLIPLPCQTGTPEAIQTSCSEIMPWPIATGHKQSYGWSIAAGADLAAGDAVASTMDCGLTASITPPFS